MRFQFIKKQMKNKTVVITGPTSGVGKEGVERFAGQDWNVIAIGRNKNKLYKVQGATYLEADISRYADVKAAFNKIDKVDLLINNAAVFKSEKLENCTGADIDTIVDTNLKGTMYCTLEALKKMGKGRIVNIGSVSGLHGIPGQTIYSATKHGLMGFSDSLAQETTQKGILITTICPGGINTPLWNKGNKYPGNVADLISPADIVECIFDVVSKPDNIVVKQVTIFPKCEWH